MRMLDWRNECWALGVIYEVLSVSKQKTRGAVAVWRSYCSTGASRQAPLLRKPKSLARDTRFRPLS